MKYHIPILIALMLFFPQITIAEQQRLLSNTFFQYELPGSQWQVSAEPPQLAVDAMYADLVFGKKQKNEDFDPEKLQAMAAKFMKTNNLYIYNEQTEAYLMISISPYTEENGPPGKKAIKQSAHWAIDAIIEHADVKDTSSFKARSATVDIPGMKYAVRVEADHPLFGEPHHFIGIIGYAHPYWVFMYYNDKLKNDTDLKEMNKILSTIKFEQLK